MKTLIQPKTAKMEDGKKKLTGNREQVTEKSEMDLPIFLCVFAFYYILLI